MKSKKKKLFNIAGIAAAALFLAAAIFALTFDMNTYKSRIEASASDATGMNVRINGSIKFMLFPSTGALLENIVVQNREADVALIKKAKVGIKLLPLLKREVVIRQIALVGLELFISKDKKGQYNFEMPEKEPDGEGVAAGQFKAVKITVKKGNVLYLDEISGMKTEAKECNFAIRDLYAGGSEFPGKLSFDGLLSCAEVVAGGVGISDIRADIKTRAGKFEINPLTMKMFGGDGRAIIRGVLPDRDAEYSVELMIAGFNFEEMLGVLSQKKSIRGKMDLKSHLTLKGSNTDEMIRTAEGKISLSGRSLLLDGIDIDRLLEKYEKSQKGNLVDVGAFLIAGPLGTALTKGYDFGNVYKESLGGEGSIEQLVSDWKISNGIAAAEDVAFTTRKNRIALKGNLDIVRDRFEDVSVAVLDPGGCAVFSQKIHGEFKNPQIDKPSILGSLLGPITSLIKKPIEMLEGDKCEVFYHGSLEHP